MLPRKLICHLRTPSITVDCRKGAGDDSSQNLVFRGQAFESIIHDTIRARHPLAPCRVSVPPAHTSKPVAYIRRTFHLQALRPLKCWRSLVVGTGRLRDLGRRGGLGVLGEVVLAERASCSDPHRLQTCATFPSLNNHRHSGADLSSASQGAGRAATGKRAP